jgi:hypothetical protein
MVLPPACYGRRVEVAQFGLTIAGLLSILVNIRRKELIVMSRRVLVLTAGLLASLAAGRASAELRWSLEAGLGGALGRAAYDLEVEESGAVVLSRLEFPLDGWEASARLACSLFRERHELWRFEVGADVGLSDPSGLMRDYDWIEFAGYPRIPSSYTESDVEAVSVAAGLKASRAVLVRGFLELYLCAGYRFGYLFQSIQGYTGWWYEWNGTAYDLWSDRDSREALRYTLYSHALPVGLGLRLAPWPRLQFLLEAAWVPVYAVDEDDHLLRYKLSTASGLGHGASCRLEASVTLSRREDGLGPYLALTADFLGWRVSTTQTQKWYGDDLAGEEDETGMVMSGIGHVITSLEFRAGLSAGVRL